MKVVTSEEHAAETFVKALIKVSMARLYIDHVA